MDFKFREKSAQIISPVYVAAFAGHTNTAMYLVSMGADFSGAERVHQRYVQRESASLQTLGLVASFGNAFLKSLRLDLDKDGKLAEKYKE